MSNRTRLFMQHLALASAIVALFVCQPVLSEDSSDTTTPTTATSENAHYSNYEKLSAALPLYENAIANPWPTIPATRRPLARGSRNSVVPLLRERLARTQDLLPDFNNGGHVFDEDLAEAVKAFQARHGLDPDGVVGNQTRAELNVSPEERVRQIRTNLERWRYIEAHPAKRYIWVNIPDFQLHLFENGEEVLNMKVIIGKVERPTPEVISTVTTIVFNPFWNVPELIANQDIVPKVINNSSYLDDENIKIYANQQDTEEIDPRDVDWDAAQENGFKYHFRQEPGEKNALGLVKFEFYNPYDIYMHDTPAKNLFEKDIRDFSSGCIRLEKPFDLVDYLAQNDTLLTQNKINDILASGNTTYIRIQHPIKIYVTYITAWVDNDGTVNFRNDLYQRDNPTFSESAPQLEAETQ